MLALHTSFILLSTPLNGKMNLHTMLAARYSNELLQPRSVHCMKI
jgi:hypothetical protein